MFHLFRMNKDVVGLPILDSQGKSIEARIFRVSPIGIYIVHSKDNLLPEKPVVKHQQRAIEVLKFVIPQDVKKFGLGCRSVAKQLRVVRQNPESLLSNADIRPRTAS
jgi:hypothetical protein